MLVEDDNNLREIYEARLLAEGYEVVSAKDGEEALALATKEKPDLIISDVMMPKISGFDMLDILRSTPEVQNTKVVMMTALSQAEDKERADKLGADKYLVKSQVTLEDVARVADELLNGAPTQDQAAAGSEPQNVQTDPAPAVAPSAPNEPQAAPTGQPQQQAATAAQQQAQQTETSNDTASTNQQQAAAGSDSSANPTNQTAPPPPAPTMPKVNTPDDTTNSNQQTNLPTNEANTAQTTAEEEEAIDRQIDDFVKNQLHSNEPAEPEQPEPTPQQDQPVDPADQLNQGEGFQLPNAEPTQTIAVKQAPGGADQQQTPSQPQDQPEPAQPEATTNNTQQPDNEPTPAQPPEPPENAPSASGGQRVIQPIHDPNKDNKPNITELAAEEEAQAQGGPLPASSVVSPNGQTVTPPPSNEQNNTANPDPTATGSIIQPSGNVANNNSQQNNPQSTSNDPNDPNNIAL